MSTEASQSSDSNFLALLLFGFVGLWYGFSLGIAITQKYSKCRIRYKILKVTFPACFALLAFFNIANFVSLENNQFEWVWPMDEENSILLIEQFLINNPYIVFQAPLSFYVGITSFLVGYKKEEGKQRSKIFWVFFITYIIFLLTPVVPNEILIVIYTAFQTASFFGVHIGIKQTSNVHLVDFIIKWVKNQMGKK